MRRRLEALYARLDEHFTVEAAGVGERDVVVLSLVEGQRSGHRRVDDALGPLCLHVPRG